MTEEIAALLRSIDDGITVLQYMLVIIWITVIVVAMSKDRD